jgi:hypothetical protein
MYKEKEVEISEVWLKNIFSLDYDMCLIGGWAVYESVTKNYEEDKGRQYVGSKDIDVGFHIDSSWNLDQLKNSDYLKFFKYLEENNFSWVGYRFLKGYDYDTKKELTKEEMSRKPSFEVIEFFIDPVVDSMNPLLRAELFINPIDEPLLSLVFENKLINRINLGNHREVEAVIPKPEVLLAMKFNSVDDRTKEHKRIKDIMDIFALIWYSELEIDEMKEKVSDLKDFKEIEKSILRFTEDELQQASKIIDFDYEDMKNIFKTFISQ